ncbi:MAG: hypothetical protein JO083_05725 [Candidatus Eremiobacteraeota bacterium]|nr:hypothetical protein [Candidatus Eremiobacteraeota bacterium]
MMKSKGRGRARMRVSDYFRLGRRQPSLDFVDVDIWGDTPLFVDPSVLRQSPTDFANNSVIVLQDFFSTVLAAIRAGDHSRASFLLAALREPNETHLGFSRNKARGRALGPTSVQNLVSAFADSAAVLSGLLTDLEDSLLLVEGIGPDLISDITINVIRGELVRYTIDQCTLYGMQLRESVPTGKIWNHQTHEWEDHFDTLPSVRAEKLLLVPKWIVRRQVTYTYNTFYSDFVLSYLERSEIALNTNLVHTLQDGRKRVYKGDLEYKYGRQKSLANRVVSEDPTLLSRYKQSRAAFLERGSCSIYFCRV